MGRLATAVMASVLVLAAACGKTETKPAEDVAAADVAETAEADESAEAALHVDVLDCGKIDVSDLDAFSSAGDYAGQTDTFTDTCFLIRHPDGIMLWDLGLPGMLAMAGPQTQQIYTVSLDKTLTSHLKDLGLTPDDIDYLAISHSHFDHIGQAAQVQNALWLVHEDELNAMFPSDGSEAQVPADQLALFAMFNPLERKTFRGDYDVFGDGSVVIFETPGHTPGHTSLQLMMPEAGPVLLAGDLYHRSESRELKRVPRFNYDEAMTLASMDAFEARAKELGATVIIQHEPQDIDPLKGEIQ
ncbi:N-acyl homoserine lactonase family protein [Hyphomonas beringensis]|nr:N-acyl homoserine lactonase family protein [Hyphomonas beringensis]